MQLQNINFVAYQKEARLVLCIGPKRQINHSKYLRTSLVENKIQGSFIFGNVASRAPEMK